jgi:hypothetical protein
MLPVKTILPDYRFTSIDDWKRYIQFELFHTQNKNNYNKAIYIFQPRLNIQP